MRRALVIAVVALAWSAQPASAVRYVDDSGSNAANACLVAATPCQTINHGLAQSAAGETVQVGGGSYDTGAGITVGGGRSIVHTDFLGGAPTAGDASISNALAAPAVQVATNNPAGRIEGFDISSAFRPLELRANALVTGNTFAQADPPSQSGAAIFINGGSPQVMDNSFDDPNASGAQNAILSANPTGAAPRIEGNQFDAFTQAIGVNGGAPTIANNVISSHRGTGIRLEETTATITGNLVKEGVGNPNIGILMIEQAGAPSTGAVLRRNRLEFNQTGMQVQDTAGAVTLDGNLIRGSSAGLFAWDTGAPGGGDVTATNVTIAGNAAREIQTTSALVKLDSSIIGDTGIDVVGSGSCSIAFTRGPAGESGTCGVFTTTAGPGFVAPENFSLLPSSPLVDAGNPAVPPAGSLDIDGKPRALDGNKDCAARRDMGAFELTALAPLPNCTPAAKPIAGTAKDVVAPAITRASMLRKVFRVGRGRTRVSARRRATKGTAFRFRLSERATVTITIRRRLQGRLSRGRCRKPTRALRKRRRCVRRVRTGALRRALPAGRHKVAFSGRIGAKALRRGRYDAVIQAVDPASNKSKPARLRFRLVR